MYCVGFWVERQKVKCKSRKCWKPPQPFPDCLRFLNVYSTVNFHPPPNAPVFVVVPRWPFSLYILIAQDCTNEAYVEGSL